MTLIGFLAIGFIILVLLQGNHSEMTMTYEDQLAIGSNLNAAIEQTLREYGVLDQPDLLGALAQAVLVQLDRAGYQITRK